MRGSILHAQICAAAAGVSDFTALRRLTHQPNTRLAGGCIKMRIRFYAVAIFAISLLSTAHAFGQRATTDLTMRRALYITGVKTDKIDLKNDKYVAENGTITISQSSATKCEDGGCYFNIGFIAFRSPAIGVLNTNALIKKEGVVGFVSKEVVFANNAATQQEILSVKLPIGAQNKLTFQIDPHKKTLESNENNNTFSVTVIVEGKP
jgi:hypothetical protein